MSGPACWLAQFTDTPCEGALVRCHLLERQKLRQAYPDGALALEGLLRTLWRCDLIEEIPERVYYPIHLWEQTVYPAGIAPAFTLDSLADDPRLWRPGCGGITGIGGHHGLLDGFKLKPPRSAIPEETLDAARELGLLWAIERDHRYAEY